MTSACCTSPPLSGGARAGLLAARWVIGGLFLFSGAAKLGWLEPLQSIDLLVPLASQGIDPANFAASVKGFRILHNDLIPFVTFLIPWLEVVAAGALLLGLATRGAARLIASLLVLFCLAMLSVIVRGIDVECTCFGKFLGGAVGWMSILRNLVILAIVWPVARYGGGLLALGNLLPSPRADRGQ